VVPPSPATTSARVDGNTGLGPRRQQANKRVGRALASQGASHRPDKRADVHPGQEGVKVHAGQQGIDVQPGDQGVHVNVLEQPVDIDLVERLAMVRGASRALSRLIVSGRLCIPAG